MVFPLNLILCCTMAISSRGHFRTNVWGPSHFSPSPYFAWGRTIGGGSQTSVSRFSSEKFLTRLLWGESCFDSFRNFWLALHCIWFNPLSKAFLFFSHNCKFLFWDQFSPPGLSPVIIIWEAGHRLPIRFQVTFCHRRECLTWLALNERQVFFLSKVVNSDKRLWLLQIASLIAKPTRY